MSDADLELLRCPIDPAREATLRRDRDQLCCQRCGTTFPIKNGLPILLNDEATLPDGIESRHQLPCRRS